MKKLLITLTVLTTLTLADSYTCRFTSEVKGDRTIVYGEKDSAYVDIKRDSNSATLIMTKSDGTIVHLKFSNKLDQENKHGDKYTAYWSEEYGVLAIYDNFKNGVRWVYDGSDLGFTDCKRYK